MQCSINPRTHLRKLTINTKTIIDDSPQVSHDIRPWNLLRTQEQTRQHHAHISEIRIAFDLRGRVTTIEKLQSNPR
jgi:hypothetical protein